MCTLQLLQTEASPAPSSSRLRQLHRVLPSLMAQDCTGTGLVCTVWTVKSHHRKERLQPSLVCEDAEKPCHEVTNSCAILEISCSTFHLPLYKPELVSLVRWDPQQMAVSRMGLVRGDLGRNRWTGFARLKLSAQLCAGSILLPTLISDLFQRAERISPGRESQTQPPASSSQD